MKRIKKFISNLFKGNRANYSKYEKKRINKLAKDISKIGEKETDPALYKKY